MSFIDIIKEKCKTCKYARKDGCLEHQNKYEPFIANDLGITCMISDEGVILYYQDIDDCDKWHNRIHN